MHACPWCCAGASLGKVRHQDKDNVGGDAESRETVEEVKVPTRERGESSHPRAKSRTPGKLE